MLEFKDLEKSTPSRILAKDSWLKLVEVLVKVHLSAGEVRSH